MRSHGYGRARALLTFTALLGLATPMRGPKATEPPTPDDAILGEWLTEKKDAKVRVTCEGGTCVGRITWLRDPNDEGGHPVADRRNPDPSLRKRSVLGLEVVWNMRPSGRRHWTEARLYDPESGQTYQGEATLEGPDSLVLRGYLWIPFFSASETWTRVKR